MIASLIALCNKLIRILFGIMKKGKLGENLAKLLERLPEGRQEHYPNDVRINRGLF
jgi:hypothetical protein